MKASRRKYRLAVFAMLAVMTGMFLWVRLSRRLGRVPEAPMAAASTHAPQGGYTPPYSALSTGSATPDALRDPQADAPVIDEISAEKSEVCEGEENLITVRAHAKDPHDN